MFVRQYHSRVALKTITLFGLILLFFMTTNFLVISRHSVNYLPEELQTTMTAIKPTARVSSKARILSPWELKQENRRRIMTDGCADQTLTLQQILQQPKENDYQFPDMAIVDEAHQLVYCSVPKVASTNWKRVFLILAGKSKPTMRDLVEFNPHDMNYFKTLRSYPLEKQVDILQNYRKFLFVRHPHNRLVSGYYDRLRYDPTVVTDENFQQLIGTYIIDHYRPKNETAVDSLKRGNDVRFSELVDYLSDETNPYRLSNGHFAPINDLCFPCQINYTYIGKYETLVEDARMILQQINVSLPFIFPPSTNTQSKTSARTVSDMYRLQPEKHRALNRIYQQDFKLFDYDPEEWKRA